MTDQADKLKSEIDSRTDAERFEQGLRTIVTTPKKQVVEYMEQKKRERQAKRASSGVKPEGK